MHFDMYVYAFKYMNMHTCIKPTDKSREWQVCACICLYARLTVMSIICISACAYIHTKIHTYIHIHMDEMCAPLKRVDST